jgi:hypothetical protein
MQSYARTTSSKMLRFFKTILTIFFVIPLPFLNPFLYFSINLAFFNHLSLGAVKPASQILFNSVGVWWLKQRYLEKTTLLKTPESKQSEWCIIGRRDIRHVLCRSLYPTKCSCCRRG